jgi:hypothetical protein
MTKNLKYTALCLFVTLLAIACSKDGADGNEVTNRNEAKKEIGLKTDVWKMAEATRAVIYNNDRLKYNGFICTAYNSGTATPNTEADIIGTDVTWSDSRWTFDGGPRYWPTSGNLDFFAYSPRAIPGYITTGPTYSYSGGQKVSFTCQDLAMTSYTQSGITEFVYAFAANKNRTNAASGVSLQFQHPFALIKLQLAANHPDIYIHSITFQNVMNFGTYSNSNGWHTEDVAKNLVWTINAEFDNNTTARQIGANYIVIPQGWTGGIVVNADCLYWGEKKNYSNLTTTVPTNWQPGYSYTYTFNISPDDLKVGTTSQFTEQW